MKNNNVYLNDIKNSLNKNVEDKTILQEKFTQFMEKCFDVHDLQDICRNLTEDKLNLYN